MTIDVEQHESNRIKFLVALYEIEQEDSGGRSENERCHERVVGQRAGLTERQWDRISSELLEEGLIDGAACGGLICELTSEGRRRVERHLYDQSALGKRRKFAAGVKAKGKEWTLAGLGKAVAWLGGLIATGFAAYNWQLLLTWMRGILP